MNQDKNRCGKCGRCGHASAEVKILGCGCSIHARCFPISNLYKQFEKGVKPPQCPCCHQNKMEGLYIFPIDLNEYTKVNRIATEDGSSTVVQSSDDILKRFYAAIEPIFHTNSSKIENNSISTATSEEIQFRNGRWTAEEVKLIDDLMELFNHGQLPIPNGTILNDFLRSMFLCKSTRLRKKIKNANFCTRTYKANPTLSMERCSLNSTEDAVKLAIAEKKFLDSIESESDRRVLKFNMSRIWCTFLINLCLQQHGYNSLHADDWLSSLEMIEKKSNQAKESKKQMERRKRVINQSTMESFGNSMMNSVELMNIVDIQHNPSLTEISFYNHQNRMQNGAKGMTPFDNSMDNDYANSKRPRLVAESMNMESKPEAASILTDTKSEAELANLCEHLADWSPFIDKITNFLQEEHLPFSYCDVWIASDHEQGAESESIDADGDKVIEVNKKASAPGVRLRHVGHGVRNDTESMFTLYHMNEFGKYSKKFAFPPGIGLPGRVLMSGAPTWDDCVQKCSLTDFPRVDGARTHGVKKALGIPLLNSSVGKIVVAMYTSEDIDRDVGIVQKCCAQFQEFNPISSWQLSLGLANTTSNQMVPSNHVSEKFKMIQLDSPKKAAHEGGVHPDAVNETNTKQESESPEDESLFERCEDDAIVNLLGRHAPSCDNTNSMQSQLGQNFTALRLLLLRNPKERTANENSIVCTIRKSYKSYLRSNRKEEEVAVLLAYDFQFMTGNRVTTVTSNPSEETTPVISSIPTPVGSGNPNAPIDVYSAKKMSHWDHTMQPT